MSIEGGVDRHNESKWQSARGTAERGREAGGSAPGPDDAMADPLGVMAAGMLGFTDSPDGDLRPEPGEPLYADESPDLSGNDADQEVLDVEPGDDPSTDLLLAPGMLGLTDQPDDDPLPEPGEPLDADQSHDLSGDDVDGKLLDLESGGDPSLDLPPVPGMLGLTDQPDEDSPVDPSAAIDTDASPQAALDGAEPDRASESDLSADADSEDAGLELVPDLDPGPEDDHDSSSGQDDGSE
jgi:hypothetical protein